MGRKRGSLKSDKPTQQLIREIAHTLNGSLPPFVAKALNERAECDYLLQELAPALERYVQQQRAELIARLSAQRIELAELRLHNAALTSELKETQAYNAALKQQMRGGCQQQLSGEVNWMEYTRVEPLAPDERRRCCGETSSHTADEPSEAARREEQSQMSLW